MDRKKLEEFIGAHAEYTWHTDPGADSRRDPCSDNPSAMMVIVRMLDKPYDCADCGKTCTKPPERSITWNHPRKAWNQRCIGCKRSLNHDTGRFEYAQKKSNVRPYDPVTGKFLKENLADQGTTDGEQDSNHVDQN